VSDPKHPQKQQLEFIDGIPTAPTRIWFQELIVRTRSKADKISGGRTGNYVIQDSNGNITDGGTLVVTEDDDGYIATDKWVAKRFITENLLPEAGTEEGRRPGSYVIGLDDDNYCYFDEDGGIHLYGTSGCQIIVPVNSTSESNDFAVLDSSGNIKYRTLAQIVRDLGQGDGDIATKKWVAEHFVTENLLDDAQIYSRNVPITVIPYNFGTAGANNTYWVDGIAAIVHGATSFNNSFTSYIGCIPNSYIPDNIVLEFFWSTVGGGAGEVIDYIGNLYEISDGSDPTLMDSDIGQFTGNGGLRNFETITFDGSSVTAGNGFRIDLSMDDSAGGLVTVEIPKCVRIMVGFID